MPSLLLTMQALSFERANMLIMISRSIQQLSRVHREQRNAQNRHNYFLHGWHRPNAILHVKHTQDEVAFWVT